MLHRSTLLAILSTALLLPTAAQAADPVVAGPTAAGTTATAHVDKHDLCFNLHPAKPPADHRFDDPTCAPLPVLAPFGFADGLAGAGDDTIYDVGVTGTDVAAVELRKDGRTLTHVATQPSALPGASDLRFYVLETTTMPDEVAYLDAAGTVRRAADFIGVRGYSFSDRGSKQSASHTLAHGKGGWKLEAYTVSPIVSTPLQPERRVTQACVRLTLPGGNGETDDTTSCDQPGLGATQLLPTSADDGCGSIGRFVGGLVRSRVAKVVLVLGSGKRVTMPLRAFPAALGDLGLRVGLVRIDAHEALRSMTAYDAAGHAIDRGLSAVAPGAPPKCSSRSGDDTDELSLSGSNEVIITRNGSRTARLGPGPHLLHVADDGAQICFAADHVPVLPADCEQPPVDPASTFLAAEPTATGRLVLAIVPPEVATARVTLDDGSRRDLTATPIPGYAGQYATSLAAVFADVPGPHRVLSYKLLDARGRVLAVGLGPERPGLRNTRRIARVPGVGALYYSDADAAAKLASPLVQVGDCLSIGRPPTDSSAFGRACVTHSVSVVTLTASCATRRIVVSAGLAHRSDRVSIRLASGREVALHTYVLPGRKGAGQSDAQAIGVLGAHDVPRALIRRGRSPQRLALHLPAAAAQCGYSDFEQLDVPDFD
jgi:hypothetical protein